MKLKTIMASLLLMALPFAGVRGELLTPENQVICLRHIFEQTEDQQQREATLKLMANAGTYQALTFATSLL